MWCCSCEKDPNKVADLHSEQVFKPAASPEPCPEQHTDVYRSDEEVAGLYKDAVADKAADGEGAGGDRGPSEQPGGMVRPRATEFEFPVVIQKDLRNPQLGLELDLSDDMTAHICLVGPGCILTYNAQAAPELHVKIGDFIVEVNGVRDDSSKFLKMLKTEANTTIIIKRPVEFCVYVTKKRNNSKLGFGYHKAARGISLLVYTLDEGLLKEWNVENPDKAVLKNDRIIAVNGIRRNTDLMAKTIEEADKLELWFVRAGGSAPP
mmetsp:Transcript_47556/g.134247  ORF Transcript_47556/g.134247 Transcript_47556/m.134247 type:complete len:264 (+) Transcript_47556:138-929(+)